MYNHRPFLLTKLLDWKMIAIGTELIPKHLCKRRIDEDFTNMILFIQKEFLENSLGTNTKLEWIESRLLHVESSLDRSWEILHSGHWKDVPIEYRYCYTICSVLKAVLLEIRYHVHETKSEEREMKMYQDNLELIDKAILLGAPLPHSPDLLTKAATKLHEICRLPLIEKKSTKPIHTEYNYPDTTYSAFKSVNCYDEPSMESFYRDIFKPKVPAKLKGCMKHWQALKLWPDINYLIKVAGARTVPIEIGSRYTEENWSIKLMKLSTFIEEYIISSKSITGYLAQHQLFEQIPELKSDFVIPDYCSFSDDEQAEQSEQPDINAWFGSYTESPLHFDPKNNLLCQVFGYKRVILYPPEDTEYLYPYDGRLLKNTSQVDPWKPDDTKYPNFRKAKGSVCVLGPGEMLYIPPKWWHHVTSYSTCFSVSFWWN